MIDYKKLAGKDLQQLTPYKPGKPIKEVQRELGVKKVIKLASNENPIGPSPIAKKALEDFVPEISRYPLGDSYYLRKSLSKLHNVCIENILCGAGSDEIIQLLYLTFLRKEDNVVAPSPSFPEYYLIAKALRSDCKWVKMNDDFTVDFDKLLERVNSKTRFVILANPNNPTGLAFTQRDLLYFLNKLPKDIIVVMDEAYIEFADYKDIPNSIELMKKYKNLVALRTFSKAYGLASMRCGYIIADKDCIDMMNRVKQPFNINMAAQLMAEAALSDQEHIKRVVEVNKKGKEYIYNECKVLGLEYIPTEANFLLINVEDGEVVFEKLLKEGIIVRFLNDPTLKSYIRVSIGTMEENKLFIEKLRKVFMKRL